MSMTHSTSPLFNKPLHSRAIGRLWRLPAFVVTFALLLSVSGDLYIARSQAQPIVNSSSALLADDSCLAVLKSQLDVNAAIVAAGVREGTRIERATAVYSALAGHASTTQANLAALLDERGAVYNQFYLVNMIEIVADPALCIELESHVDVDRVEDNPIVHGSLAVDNIAASWAERRMNEWLWIADYASARATQAVPYGLEVSGAVDAHELGYLGSGITIASQDTGVQWNHPLLKSKYRGWTSDDMPVAHQYNWFDVWGTENRSRCDDDAQIPCDDNGHGTHTVGTMLGGDPADDTLIGMAPDANWIGCRNMLGGLGRPSSYTACFEFFLAPYPQGGNKLTDGKPQHGPDIINNSWGCPPEEGCDESASLILEQVVDTVRAVGQFVVASAGNKGSSCGSVNQPIATHDSSFSIGAHDSFGRIASFSSRGPVLVDASGRPKPDISAPGVDVMSARVMGDVTGVHQPLRLSGTSMASPHVAGAAALLWSAAPSLNGDIERTEEVLIKSANPSSSPMVGCAGGSESGYDYAHGYGQLDIVEAIELARNPVTVTVTITSFSRTGQAITGVSLEDEFTGEKTIQSIRVGLDAGSTTVIPASTIVQFPNLISGNYIVRIENDSEVVQELAIETTPGMDSAVEISEFEQFFFPVLVGDWSG